MRLWPVVTLVALAACFDPAIPGANGDGGNDPVDALRTDAADSDREDARDGTVPDAQATVCPIARTVFARTSMAGNDASEIEECAQGADGPNVIEGLPETIEWVVVRSRPQRVGEAAAAVMIDKGSEDPELRVYERGADDAWTWDQESSPSLDQGSIEVRSYDLAYGQENGSGMVVFGDDDVMYRLLADEGAREGRVYDLAEDARTLWLELAADPGSDKVLVGFVARDTSEEICDMFHALVWDGSSWGNAFQECSGATNDRRSFDVAWIDGDPWAFYASTSDSVSAKRVDSGEAPTVVEFDDPVELIDVAVNGGRVVAAALDAAGVLHALAGPGLEGAAVDEVVGCSSADNALFPAAVAWITAGDAFALCRDTGQKRIKYTHFTSGAWTADDQPIPGDESVSLQLSFQAGSLAGGGAFVTLYDADDGNVFFATAAGDGDDLFQVRNVRMGAAEEKVDGTVAAYTDAVD